jgi:hypothetical protein
LIPAPNALSDSMRSIPGAFRMRKVIVEVIVVLRTLNAEKGTKDLLSFCGPSQ